MKPIDLLETIGSIRDKYILDAHSKQSASKKVLPFRKAFLIAAVIAMLLLLVGCVAVIMGLHELEIGSFTYEAENGERQSGDFISLQGYIDSDNYKASQEWNQFLAQYDPDGTLLKESEEIGFIPPIDYMAYLCYTPDMVKQIDDICSKYNLKLLGPTYTANASTEIYTMLGIDSITAPDACSGVNLGSGYYYRDGSFNLEGSLELADGDGILLGEVIFEYRCIKKTAFDGVALNIGDTEAYDQWNYTTSDGTEVLLAMSENKAMIIAEKGNFFITINILVQHMTRAGLETAADAFIFTYTPQQPDPNALVEPDWYPEETTEETTVPETTPEEVTMPQTKPVKEAEPKQDTPDKPSSTASNATPTEITVGKSTIDDVVTYYQAKYPGKEIKSVYLDFDGNGFGDLAVWCDGAFWSIYVTDEEDRVKAEYLIDGGFDFYETYAQMEQQVQYAGNLIGIIEKKGNATYQKFCWLGENLYLRECFKFDPNGTDSNYFVSVLDSWDTPYDVETTQWKPLTEAEYMERLGAYTIQAYNLKNIAEYYLR